MNKRKILLMSLCVLILLTAVFVPAFAEEESDAEPTTRFLFRLKFADPKIYTYYSEIEIEKVKHADGTPCEDWERTQRIRFSMNKTENWQRVMTIPNGTYFVRSVNCGGEYFGYSKEFTLDGNFVTVYCPVAKIPFPVEDIEIPEGGVVQGLDNREYWIWHEEDDIGVSMMTGVWPDGEPEEDDSPGISDFEPTPTDSQSYYDYLEQLFGGTPNPKATDSAEATSEPELYGPPLGTNKPQKDEEDKNVKVHTGERKSAKIGSVVASGLCLLVLAGGCIYLLIKKKR